MLFFSRVQRQYFVAAAFSAGVAAVVCFATAAEAQSETPPAAEMLQDGLDALADQQRDLAAQFFEQLVVSYPGTNEADRAERELKSLGDGTDSPRDSEKDEKELNPAKSAEAVAALRLRFTTDAGDRVFFAENSSVLGGRARTLLESQARWLAKRPDLKLTIIGRADDGGSAEDAAKLSLKRAEVVRDKLVSAGVAPMRIAVEGRGSRDPIATCQTALCQAQNRHVETFLGGLLVTGSDANRKTAGSGGVTVSR
jgi:peptidoglycan-associated lipoprotein